MYLCHVLKFRQTSAEELAEAGFDGSRESVVVSQHCSSLQLQMYRRQIPELPRHDTQILYE
jgi:hypothetical protein